MADAPQNDTFRVASIVGPGSTTFNDTIGGTIDETIGIVASRPGARLSPAACIDSYDCRCVARSAKRYTPIVRGTAGSFTFDVLEIGGSSGSIVVANMVASEYHANLNVKPHEHEQHGFYNAGGTEDLAPISIT